MSLMYRLTKVEMNAHMYQEGSGDITMSLAPLRCGCLYFQIMQLIHAINESAVTNEGTNSAFTQNYYGSMWDDSLPTDGNTKKTLYEHY